MLITLNCFPFSISSYTHCGKYFHRPQKEITSSILNDTILRIKWDKLNGHFFCQHGEGNSTKTNTRKILIFFLKNHIFFHYTKAGRPSSYVRP